MVKFFHSLSKFFAVAWTVICLLWAIAAFMGLSNGAAQSPDAEAAVGIAGFIGFVFIGSCWLFPTLFWLIVMYISRPSAWPDKLEQKAVVQDTPPAESV